MDKQALGTAIVGGAIAVALLEVTALLGSLAPTPNPMGDSRRLTSSLSRCLESLPHVAHSSIFVKL
jgi:hypothetical protein